MILLALPAMSLEFTEAFRIRLVDSRDGSVEVSLDQGKTFLTLGHVIYPTAAVNPKGFTASQWIGTGEVAASAVNAIHIKVDGAKTIFSILPRDFLNIPKGYNSYLSPDSTIYTDLDAGKGIFGGDYSPYVGNKVYIFDKPLNSAPKIGDIITIVVTRPARWPKEIDLENRFGGRVTVVYPDGSSEVVAEVLRPVAGVGRFSGSRFISAGRIRANHPGVIDISTSVGDKVGGFQIIPSGHAQSPEMGGARTLTQWMVVGPTRVGGASLEGVAPLFKYFLKPEYNEDDLSGEGWESKLLSRYLVEVKYKESDRWQPMPIFTMNADEELPEEANRALEKVTNIRILFPIQ
ncbi:MAG TPA: hypothetical protein VMD02_01225 [Candidatus Omnitrophota bacterium]|nr:hypothetical protein [Candidatus Omnitrophota bacterium]